ncbi:MAG: RNA polymerase sigma factor [Mariniblastus sp.]
MLTQVEKRKKAVLEALDELERPLVKYATRLLSGDENAARDAVQHAFLKLCSTAELPPNIPAWLYTVCRNRAMDRLRQLQRESQTNDQEGLASSQVASRDLGPSEQLERDDLLRLIQELISQLSPTQREMAELWSQGFSNQEISAVSGKTESTVRVNLHRAIKSIRQHPMIRTWVGDGSETFSPVVLNGVNSKLPTQKSIK